MLEMPDAKRVRREDLLESEPSLRDDAGRQESDADLQAQLDAQMARSLGIDIHRALQQQQIDCEDARTETRREAEGDAPDGCELDFRLFRSTAPTKVVLEDDAATLGDGAVVFPRPSSFYLARHMTDALKQQYGFAAVSGEDVLLRSHHPSWGMACPWKVTRIACPRRAGPGAMGRKPACEAGGGEGKRRCRPGKKRRIAVRKELKAKAEKEEAAAKMAQEKEERGLEKRKRMHRLKKLRRRAKNKEKRALSNSD